MAKNKGTGKKEDKGTRRERKPSPPPSLGLGTMDDGLARLATECNHDPAKVPALPAAEAPRGRQGDDSRPYCPRHNCLCQAHGTAENVTHYRCPVAGCDTREKKIRPSLKMPAAPQACPQRNCAPAGDRPQVFLEVDTRLGSLAHLHMFCPQCGFHVNVPKPQFDGAAALRAQRQAEDLAAR